MCCLQYWSRWKVQFGNNIQKYTQFTIHWPISIKAKMDEIIFSMIFNSHNKDDWSNQNTIKPPYVMITKRSVRLCVFSLIVWKTSETDFPWPKQGCRNWAGRVGGRLPNIFSFKNWDRKWDFPYFYIYQMIDYKYFALKWNIIFMLNSSYHMCI